MQLGNGGPKPNQVGAFYVAVHCLGDTFACAGRPRRPVRERRFAECGETQKQTMCPRAPRRLGD